jgi:hypothetical protein
MGRPNDWSCRKPNRRYDKITAEILLMLSTMPDGTKFHVQAYSNGHWAFNNNQYMLNSVAARNALTQWFVKMSPHGGTYMTTGLNALLTQKGKAKTLYMLADGSTDQSTSSLYAAARSSGQPINVVGVDLKIGDAAYKNLHTIATLTGGSEKYFK